VALLALLASSCGGGASEAEVGEASSIPGEADSSAAALARLGARGRAEGFDLVVVTLDTVRADHVGCYGAGEGRTPAVDRLAARGLRFEHAFAPAPITLPSHASLFTGLDVPSHGVRNNGTFSLEAGRTTLAEHLREAGYATGAFVGAYVLDARFGLDQGFDHYDDAVNPSGSARRSGHFNERSAEAVTDAALAWMEGSFAASPEQPHFIWLHYFDAHHPYEPPAAFAERFPGDPYAGEIAAVDAQLVRVVEFVEAAGRAERTLWVVTADHGEGLGEHDEATHTRLLYDSTLRVPLVIASPGLFEESAVVRDRVAGLVDLLPTLLALLGLEPPAGLDGRPLLEAAPDPARALYAETLVPLLNHGWAPLFALHRLEDKFIRAPRPEYYDLARDPGELRNLYPDPPAAAELEAVLAARLAGGAEPAELRGLEGGLDPETAKRMAALGYTRSAAPAEVGTLDPKDMMPLLARAMRARGLSDAGNQEEAQRVNDAILERNPGDAYAWETASLIHLRRRRLPEAEAALERCLSIQATAEGFVRLAQLQLARGDLAAMQGSLARAEALDPREGGVHMVAGDALATQGRFAEARQAFERALELDEVKWGGEAREKLRLLEGRR